MKKLILLAMIALALTAGTMVLNGAGNTKAQTTCTDPAGCVSQVYECFNLQGGRDQPLPDPRAIVRLITQNFGGDAVRVRQARQMCELALKFPPGSTPGGTAFQTSIFECFNIERGSDPNDRYLLTTANFGPDVVTVRKANTMCEEATKANAAGVIFGSIDQPRVWECYRLNDGDKPNLPFTLLTNNFGPDGVTVRDAFMMCEEARKDRPTAAGVVSIGEPTGNVLECYHLRSQLDPKAVVTLNTTNFGSHQATVRNAIVMCEPAQKTPLFDLPGGDDTSGSD
ncbi:MAG TPA: hypothetical protein VFB90_07970 [Dehalococcoidia bacterium]|nr:hypothetical protein [Dehalococcoidia bacterium]